MDSPILEEIGTVVVLATTEQFVAREKLVEDVSGSGRPRILFIGPNFTRWFLWKVEGPAAEIALRYAKLMSASANGSIMNELGDIAETMLTQAYELILRQPSGEEGVLLTDGRANIFYVRDVSRELRAVNVYWTGNGWHVGADLVTVPGGWDDGARVFSRNS